MDNEIPENKLEQELFLETVSGMASALNNGEGIKIPIEQLRELSLYFSQTVSESQRQDVGSWVLNKAPAVAKRLEYHPQKVGDALKELARVRNFLPVEQADEWVEEGIKHGSSPLYKDYFKLQHEGADKYSELLENAVADHHEQLEITLKDHKRNAGRWRKATLLGILGLTSIGSAAMYFMGEGQLSFEVGDLNLSGIAQRMNPDEYVHPLEANRDDPEYLRNMTQDFINEFGGVLITVNQELPLEDRCPDVMERLYNAMTSTSRPIDITIKEDYIDATSPMCDLTDSSTGVALRATR